MSNSEQAEVNSPASVEQTVKTAEPVKYTVLCVDDETSILRSMKRIFHGKPFRLVLADSAQKAFDFMQKQTVHVVISDMKMPGMNGPEFLTKVASNFPQTYRIVLSGFADLESTLDVINNGQVHRFLQKPWDNNVLLEAVEQGVIQHKLEAENKKLLTLTAKQNKELSSLNSTLETKVAQRTQQLKTALSKSERGATSVKKVMYNMLSSNPLFSGAFAKSVSKVAQTIAQEMQLDEQVVSDISFSALICEIGMLSLDSAILKTPFSKLSPAQKEAFYTQAGRAQLILAPAQLPEVTNIIINQFEFVNGRGFPNALPGSDIPVGAKILAVARDFVRYRMGRINGSEYDVPSALEKVNNYCGLQYDGSIVNILKKTQMAENVDKFDIGLTSAQLKPGMMLHESLYNDNDILILPQGHIFDEESIAKIIALEQRFNMSLSILIEE
ncbi:response regulator [Glaciecola sp. MH2013]|uniref:HD domain-containing phosphohydrolase n=1 Tax=Glaciecola sp. MH2013 TaxID=2785524 RepID=UPI00189F1606|nr:HD domain-containing phosphohydrolase [Glaciecola sp. MH2013]MBF7073504.1 response regulator [Glaciecola sp. MH2013]